jgi:hypothetical protein
MQFDAGRPAQQYLKRKDALALCLFSFQILKSNAASQDAAKKGAQT